MERLDVRGQGAGHRPLKVDAFRSHKKEEALSADAHKKVLNKNDVGICLTGLARNNTGLFLWQSGIIIQAQLS